MSKTFRFSLSIITAIALIASFLVYFTYCFTSINQETIGLASGHSVIDVNVELNKFDKNNNTPISKTVFYLYDSNNNQIGARFITDENGKINTSLKRGEYYFKEISPSTGYTYDQNENNEIIKKYPFTVNGKKDEKVIINAYNIRLKGSLIINKIVKNVDDSNLTLEQLNEEFEFKITFSTDEEYTYMIDNLNQHTIKSGETIKLKHGQSISFNDLPVGLLYNITELPKEGYIINSTNHQGNITENQTISTFTNYYDQAFTPSEEKIKLTITKKLEGEHLEKDKDKDFTFKLLINENEETFTLKKDETKEFEIPQGSTYQIIENDYFNEEYSQTIVNGQGTAYKTDIETVITNTFIGEPKIEISGEKTWITNNQNITLPDSITINIKNKDTIVDTKQITPNQDNKWLYTFLVPKYDSDGNIINYTLEEQEIKHFKPTYDNYNITNTYISPINVKLPNITKIINGENIPESYFNFMLKGPNLNEDNTKIYKLQNQGTISLGEITFDKPGTYIYTLSELNTGVKGFIYDKTTYKITITITEENNILSSNITHDKELIFTNIYRELKEETIKINGKIIWIHGSNPKDKRPNSVIINIYANDEQVIQKQITNKDKWSYEFELPKYDENNQEIIYKIDQNKLKKYKFIVKNFNITNKYIEPKVPNPPTLDDIMSSIIAMIISTLTLLTILIIYINKKTKKSVNKKTKKST